MIGKENNITGPCFLWRYPCGVPCESRIDLTRGDIQSIIFDGIFDSERQAITPKDKTYTVHAGQTPAARAEANADAQTRLLEGGESRLFVYEISGGRLS